jgi:N-acylneuraminate cytidylyltransferase
MVAKVEILAVVPARGGSKSLPQKNIRTFVGHPLLAYSIAAGLQSSLVNRVVVSTDDEQTAAIAKSYGAEVPFLRPSELALDTTPDLPVFLHVLKWLAEEQGYRPDIVVQLRPTTPIRPVDCVDRGIAILIENPQADSVRAVVHAGQNPFKMWRISEAGELRPLLDEGIHEAYNQPRQKLPLTYWQTGHVDIIRRQVITEKKSMTGDIILPLVLDPQYTVDIDSALDWERAEWKVQQSDFEIIRPGRAPRPLPSPVELLVLDFDGVLTDNRVWTDGEGREWVAANRSDGWGIARLKDAGIPIVVLSTEVNPVVAARCEKLGLEYSQGLGDKTSALREMIEKYRVEANQTVYLGNDVNDLPCFPLVGCAVVVSDAHQSVRSEADLVLKNKGGYGAVRELCDLILAQVST